MEQIYIIAFVSETDPNSGKFHIIMPYHMAHTHTNETNNYLKYICTVGGESTQLDFPTSENLGQVELISRNPAARRAHLLPSR